MMTDTEIEQMMYDREEKIEITVSEYIKLREEVHALRSRCALLDAVVGSIMTALKNGGIK